MLFRSGCITWESIGSALPGRRSIVLTRDRAWGAPGAIAVGGLEIWRSGALMLLFSLVQAAGQLGATWFGALTAMSLGRDLRAAIFDRALSFSTREMREFGASSLLTRNTNDVLQVQTIVQTTLTIIVGAPIMMVGGFVMAVREDFGLSWIIAVSVAVLGVAVLLRQAPGVTYEDVPSPLR